MTDIIIYMGFSRIITVKMETFTKRQKLFLGIFSFINMCNALQYSLIAPFYPKEAEKHGITASQFGFVFGVYDLGLFISSLIFGTYLNIIDPTVLYFTGAITTGLACAAFGFLNQTNNKYIFLSLSYMLRILLGLGTSATFVASFTVIVQEFPVSVGISFSILETCFGVGLIIGPIVSGALYDLGGYSLPFLVIGITFIVITTASRTVFPEIKISASTSIFKLSQSFKALKILPVLIYNYIVFVSFFDIGFIQATLELHIRSLNLSPLGTGIVFISSGIGYVLTSPFWGHACDKHVDHLKTFICIGSLLKIFAFSLVGPAPFIPLSKSHGLCMLALALYGVGNGGMLIASFAAVQVTVINYGFPQDMSTFGVVTGIWIAFSALGGFLGPCIFGYLYDAIGFSWTSQILVAIHVFNIVMLSGLKLQKKKTIDFEKISRQTKAKSEIP